MTWLFVIVWSEKLQTESFPNFKKFRPEFCPEFCSEFSPKFSRIFRASFRGKRRPEKNSPKIPASFQCKILRQIRKNIYKMFLESRRVSVSGENLERKFLKATVKHLSGPLNRLNAILSLLHPLDRYRTASAIGSAIERPLSRPISHPNTGGSPQPPPSKPLRGLNLAIVAL